MAQKGLPLAFSYDIHDLLSTWIGRSRGNGKNNEHWWGHCGVCPWAALDWRLGQPSLHGVKAVSTRFHEVSSLMMSATGNKSFTERGDRPANSSLLHSQSLANLWPVSCGKTVDYRRRLLKLWKNYRNQRSLSWNCRMIWSLCWKTRQVLLLNFNL